jgi:hypothetical protein
MRPKIISEEFMKNRNILITGIIAFFALGLILPPLQAGERSEKHKTVVVITDKGRTHHGHGEEIDLRALEALKNLNIRVRVNDKRIKIDLRGLERKIERSAKRWERKLDRKMEDLESRGILKAIRILEDLDLDLDFDFDFDFDFDWDRD